MKFNVWCTGLMMLASASMVVSSASALSTVSDHAWQSAPTIPGNNCIDNNTNGFPNDCRTVMANLVKGTWVYNGGSIDTVLSGNGAATYTQFRNLFRYSPVTGVVNGSFAPRFYTNVGTSTTPDYSVVPAGIIRKIVSGPGNSIYVAGDFRQVSSSGSSTIINQNGLAKVNTTTGEIDPLFKPNLDCAATYNKPCTIFTAAYIDTLNYVLVGGLFTAANGSPETGFVILDGTTGATIPRTKVTLARNLRGARPYVRTIAINPVNHKEFFIGGEFSDIGVYPNTFQTYRYGMLKLQFDANNVLSSSSWNAMDALSASRPYTYAADLAHGAPLAGKCGVSATWLRQMTYSEDGKYIVLGAGLGGAYDVHPALCDTLSVFNAQPVNGVYDQRQMPLVYNHTATDTIDSVCVLNKVAYIGGHFRSNNMVVYKSGVRTSAVPYYVSSTPTTTKPVLSQGAPNAHFGFAAINIDPSVPSAYGLAVPTWNNTQLVSIPDADLQPVSLNPFPWGPTAATTTGRGYGWNAVSCVPAAQSPTGKDLVIFGGDGRTINGDKTRNKIGQFNGL